MSRWKPILGALLIFVFGLVTGGLLSGVMVKKRIQKDLRGGAETLTPVIVRRLDAQLRLSPEQRKRVSEIVADTQKQLSQVRRDMQPKLDEILKTSNAEIQEVLDPRQKQKFTRITERIHRWGVAGPP